MRFNNWVVLQNLNRSQYVESDGTIDTFGEKEIVKTFRSILSIENSNGYVGEVPQNVTVTCSYCHLKRNFFDVVKLFGLQDGVLKNKMDHILIYNDT